MIMIKQSENKDLPHAAFLVQWQDQPEFSIHLPKGTTELEALKKVIAIHEEIAAIPEPEE